MKNVLKFNEPSLFIRGTTSDNWGDDITIRFPSGIKKEQQLIFSHYDGGDFEEEYTLLNVPCFLKSDSWGASLENSETEIFLTPLFFKEPTAPESIKLLTIEGVIYRGFLPVLKGSEGNNREIYRVEIGKIPLLIAEGEVKRYENVRELLKKRGLL